MQATVTVVPRAERTTLSEAGERYIEHLAAVKQGKRTTIKDYRGYLTGHLVPHFGERAIERIEPEHVEAYMHRKLETLAPKTVTNQLNFLHGLFAFAVRRRWSRSNPVASVDRPPAGQQHATRIRFLQPVEVEALLRAVPDDELGPIDRALYLAAVMTGLRQGELLARPAQVGRAPVDQCSHGAEHEVTDDRHGPILAINRLSAGRTGRGGSSPHDPTTAQPEPDRRHRTRARCPPGRAAQSVAGEIVTGGPELISLSARRRTVDGPHELVEVGTEGRAGPTVHLDHVQPRADHELSVMGLYLGGSPE